jgi:tRNA A22 N-methylase
MSELKNIIDSTRQKTLSILERKKLSKKEERIRKENLVLELAKYYDALYQEKRKVVPPAFTKKEWGMMKKILSKVDNDIERAKNIIKNAINEDEFRISQILFDLRKYDWHTSASPEKTLDKTKKIGW